jgi:hypothetical protein
LPVPPSVEATAPDVLLLSPGAEPVTFAAKVHDPFAGRVAPDRLMVPEPAVAVIVPPPHDPDTPFGVATASPAGNGSMNPTPDRPVAFGLLIVKLSDVVPLNGIEPVPNALEMEGGATTVRLSDAVLPVPVSVELTAPDVLFLTPAVVPVTLTAKVQDALALIVPPDKVTVPLPAVAVADPPHPLLKPFGLETTNPDGRLSVNPTPVKEAAFGFVIVNVKLVVPFSGIVDDPNALAIDGASPTFKVANESVPLPASVDVTGSE